MSKSDVKPESNQPGEMSRGNKQSMPNQAKKLNNNPKLQGMDPEFKSRKEEIRMWEPNSTDKTS